MPYKGADLFTDRVPRVIITKVRTCSQTDCQESSCPVSLSSVSLHLQIPAVSKSRLLNTQAQGREKHAILLKNSRTMVIAIRVFLAPLQEASFASVQGWASSVDLAAFDVLLCIANKADLVPDHHAHDSLQHERPLQWEQRHRLVEVRLFTPKGFPRLVQFVR